jgi:hypothetical protein
MNNLTPQEIQELLEMGIDPSSVVSAYNEADLGSFINNTVGKLKNAFVYQPEYDAQIVDPSAPPQGGTAFNLSKGTGSSVFNTGAPLNVTNPNQPSQIQMTGSNAPSVTNPIQVTQSGPTKLQSAYQKTKEFATKAEDYLKDKYQDKIKDGKSFKPFDKPMQSLVGAISYGAGMNQAAQVQEQNRMAYQSPFKEAGNTKEYYKEDFIGENDPMYFLNSRFGAKAEAAPMYAANGVPIEAEGGEFYLDPSTGATLPIHGPSHEDGGVKMVAEQGSYIMSDNVKIPGSFVNDMLKKNVLPPKKQYTISDVIRQFPQHFDTKADAERLANKSLDPIAKNSYEMNMRKKLGNVSKLLAYQQTMNGGHGEEQGPEARYGMEINGAAPLSFDYRPDELRVKDMQEMQQQQMPTARKGIKNKKAMEISDEEHRALVRQLEQQGLVPKSVDVSTNSTTAGPSVPGALDQARLSELDRLVSTGKITKQQGDLLKQNMTIKPDGSLSINYNKDLAGMDKTLLGNIASSLGNRYVGFTNIPEDIKTLQGQNVSLIPGSRKEQFYDKVSDKTFNSMEEYNKYKQDNPQIYKEYAKTLEHYTTQKEYYGDKMNTPEEAVNILKQYDDDGKIDHFVLKPEMVTGADGKPDPQKLEEIVKAFNSLQGSTPNKKGNRGFEYKDEKGNTHTITQGATPGLEGSNFFAGLTPDMAAAYYVYKTYGQEAYDQHKGDPNALKNIWGKDAIGLSDEDLKSDAWTSGKFFDKEWTKRNEQNMPAGLRAALGNDNLFGMDHMDPRYQKILNVDPEKRIIPGVGEMQFEGEPDQTLIPPPPKKKPPYKERLPLGQYMGLLPSPRTQNYLPEYRQERYEPNLISLRSAKNDQVAAMNSMLQQQGMNPATMSARQASLYGEAAKNIGAITEQENNTNAQILNQAKAQNAQMANQINAMQQNANRQFVTENAQDLAALDADRYKKLSDLYSAQQKVNQYNAQLNFLDQHAGPNYDYGLDKEGNITLSRNDKKVDYDPSLAAATAKTQGLATSVESSKTTNTNTTTPEKKEENANTTTTKRLGGKNKNYRMLY